MMNQPYAYTPAPQRSGIPKVIGILMIIFGSLAVLIGLIGLATGPDKQFAHIPEWREFERITTILGFVGMPISILGFITGICAVKYKTIAPKLATVYGLLAMVHTLINAFVVHKYMRAALDAAVRDVGGRIDSSMNAAMGVGVILGTIIGLAWPIIVLVLMNRPAAKTSCQH